MVLVTFLFCENQAVTLSLQAETLVCGVNSTVEKLEKGENENCRVFGVKDHKYDVTSTLTSPILISF